MRALHAASFVALTHLLLGGAPRLASAQTPPAPPAAAPPAPPAGAPPVPPSAAPPAPPPDAAPPAPAPPAAPPPAASPGDGPTAEQAAATAAQARELNRQGITMLDAGDLERALDHFLRSRQVLPTTKNTTNAAIVLARLGRNDESLELYEELLLRFAGGLDDEDRAAIAPAMADLRTKVGSIAVSSSVGGTVFVDGRARGRLPLSTPLRVLPGTRSVRVTRPGFVDHVATVEVEAGRSFAVEASMAAVPGVGRIEVEEVDGARATVFVDGVNLGPTPLEGAVPPGQHLIWLRVGEDRGTAPAWIQVVDGQSALVRLKVEPLGPPLTVQVTPRTARVDVDGLDLGADRWSGRLPAGTHVVTVKEPGYETATRKVELPAGGEPVEVDVRLPIDPDHPRWPRPEGQFLVEVHGGLLVGPGLGGDADDACPERCTDSDPAFGFQVGARGGYRFPVGIAIELGAGYLSLRQSVARTETDTFAPDDTTVTYRLQDEAHVHGPFAAIGASFRKELGSFYLGGRGSVGMLLAISRDPVTGTAETTGEPVPVLVEVTDRSVVSAAPFLGPEAFGGIRLGPVDVGLALGLVFFPTEGRAIDRGRVEPDASGVEPSDPPDADDVESAPATRVLDEERAHGGFFVVSPALTVSTVF